MAGRGGCAALLATHITKKMLFEAQFNIAEGKFDRLTKRFLALLTKHGGSLDRRSLMKNLHVDCQLFRRLVLTLHMRDEIIEETECGKIAIYSLKNAG